MFESNSKKPRVKVSQKTRAKSLFFSLKNEFSFGKPYQQEIKGYDAPFEVHQLRKNGKRFRIAICDQPYLVTILCFDEGNAWWERFRRWIRSSVGTGLLKDPDPVVMRIYAGKLCPQHDQHHHFYREVLDIGIMVPGAAFMRAFPYDELCAELSIPVETSHQHEFSVSLRPTMVMEPCVA